MNTCQGDLPSEPITGEWLKAHGWRLGGPRNDPRTTLLGFRRLAVAQSAITWPEPFRSPDDLCIDMAPVGEGNWFCWLFQAEPYRFIHCRRMRETWEVIRLYEGLTGRRWEEEAKR